MFVYIGAPIANLNIFIDRYCPKILVGVSDGLCGAHTFSKLYRYIGKLLSININISSIFKFEFSGGHEIGNVYTMFASPLFDFGYIGVVFVVLIMGIYYGSAYNNIMCSKKNKSFDYRLFIYAYLINDLIMSFFSNRFFETVCDAPFIKFFIVSFFIYFCFYSKKIYFPRVYIKVHRNKRR